MKMLVWKVGNLGVKLIRILSTQVIKNQKDQYFTEQSFWKTMKIELRNANAVVTSQKCAYSLFNWNIPLNSKYNRQIKWSEKIIYLRIGQHNRRIEQSGRANPGWNSYTRWANPHLSRRSQGAGGPKPRSINLLRLEPKFGCSSLGNASSDSILRCIIRTDGVIYVSEVVNMSNGGGN